MNSLSSGSRKVVVSLPLEESLSASSVVLFSGPDLIFAAPSCSSLALALALASLIPSVMPWEIPLAMAMMSELSLATAVATVVEIEVGEVDVVVVIVLADDEGVLEEVIVLFLFFLRLFLESPMFTVA